jgi:branched-subunit amino acid aminotransferase/4-amino-4-deoxychorismate lyase
VVFSVEPKAAGLIGKKRNERVRNGGPAIQPFVEKSHFALSSDRSLDAMSVNGDFFRFVDGELVPVDIALADPLTVADSWFVSDGFARAMGKHLKRFSDSISDPNCRKQLPAFFDQVISTIPPEGDWFPRIEYRAERPEGERLFLRLRPAPERTETCTLWTYDKKDPRQLPTIKGPDLSVCQSLRRAANLHGADEAVLLDADGFISDGALSAIVWWQGETLCAPDDQTPWLPSVTRELVFSIASQAGYQTKALNAKPQDLLGAEVWSLSALQGIRGVTAWNGVSIGELKLLNPFRKRLKMLLEPVSRVQV